LATSFQLVRLVGCGLNEAESLPFCLRVVSEESENLQRRQACTVPCRVDVFVGRTPETETLIDVAVVVVGCSLSDAGGYRCSGLTDGESSSQKRRLSDRRQSSRRPTRPLLDNSACTSSAIC